jgi:large subunit ribosomal protein L24
MKIRTGDTVYVISGKDKGKTGTVVRVLPLKNRLVIEGVNMRVRHIRKTTQGPGQRIRYEASIAVSNVMILDPKTKKPTRVGYKIDEKTGVKMRFAKSSGEIIKAAATTKPEKAKSGATKSKKKGAEGTKVTEGADGKKGTSATSAPSSPSAPPKKAPFWKRAFSGGPEAQSDGAKRSNEASGQPAQQIHRTSRESS